MVHAGKDSLFSFLFDSDWEYYDNTATGVSKRIDYFLDQGFPKELEGLDASTVEFNNIAKELY